MKATLEMMENQYVEVVNGLMSNLDKFVQGSGDIKESIKNANWSEFEKIVRKDCIKLRRLQRCYNTELNLQAKAKEE